MQSVSAVKSPANAYQEEAVTLGGMSQNNDPQSPGQGSQGYGPPPSYGPSAHGPQGGQQPPFGGQPGRPGYGQPGPPPGGPGYPPPGQPGYGPPPGAYAPPPGGKPEIRPRLVWIFLSWLVFVASIAVFVFGTASSVESIGSDVAPATTFRSGEAETLTLDPAVKPVLYASATSQVNFQCEAQDASGGPVALTKPGFNASFTHDGRLWEYVFDIGVTSPGQYTITCRAPEGADIVFGIGKPFTAEQLGSTFGSILVYVGLMLVTFLVAVLVTIIVLVRRSRARRRLAGQWQPYGGR